jgi:hypothetical protein
VREQVRVHEVECEVVEPVGTRQKQLLLAQVHRLGWLPLFFAAYWLRNVYR